MIQLRRLHDGENFDRVFPGNGLLFGKSSKGKMRFRDRQRTTKWCKRQSMPD
ncbi:hypothetical protein RRSWK_00335 [Rhodopirellula sp. SWK7]|nr:hypothetical protein RRSWK_00335 [Rhodopirellula sp. SWK7]